MQILIRTKSAEKEKTAFQAEDYARIPHKSVLKAVSVNKYKEKYACSV